MATSVTSSVLPVIVEGGAPTRRITINTMTAAVVAVAGLASAALVWLVTRDAVLVGGVAAGLVAMFGIIVLMRAMAPRRESVETTLIDWSVARAAAENDTTGIAFADRSGRLVCANDLYASWFGGFVKPQAIAFTGRGADRLTAAIKQAWRDGSADRLALSFGPLDFEIDIARAGRSDDHLVFRFATVRHVDFAHEAALALNGRVGSILGQAGVMAVLVGREGRIRAASPAFSLRAVGRAEGVITGRDFASFLRVDERGMVFFARESERATPLRVIQLPIDPTDDERGPVMIGIIDEDGGALERGAALSYIETLLSMLPFGLAMVDRDGRFLFVNKSFARAAGVPGTRTPAYPGDLVVREDKAALGDAIRRYATGQQLSGDLAVRLKSQPEEPVVISVAGVRGLGDAAVLLSFKDTSEETRLKRQVAQATKMQAVGQLAGGVAHDFNNILTAILGYCDLMLLRHSPGDSDYDDIQQIRNNSNRAANLTRQLLAFSRQQTLRPQILQLPDVVSEVSSLLARLLDEKVRLVVRHGRGLGSVRADPGQLEQVIVNLAVNARDAMLAKAEENGGKAEEGSELLIETYGVSAAEVRKLETEILPTADYSVLRISDTGSGISPDDLGKIFEPFFTTKEIGKGTGLGLSTVYGIIKQSGGYIFADSTVGVGTSFTIYLPVHSRPVPATKRTPKVRKKDRWGTGTVLLVEDEDMVRAVAERALVRAGYKVVAAADGEEALERLAEMDTINLLVSDVVMPRMDGPTMARKVRELRPDVPILFMSGYAEEQLRESISLANVSFLAKPFSVAQLSEAAALAMQPA